MFQLSVRLAALPSLGLFAGGRGRWRRFFRRLWRGRGVVLTDSLVAGSAAGAADAAGGAGAGSVFGQGCSLGDELVPADQGLGHGTSPVT
jgi:hypothetical protein